MNAAPHIAAAPAAAPVIPAEKLTLDTLPDDVLNSVWTYLDNPASLARINKRFYALGKDTFWRARWLVQRYDAYEVIYEAIARPKIFTRELFHQLLRFKMPFTVNLVQLLHCQFNPASRTYVLGEADVRWGRISFTAYSAVISRAVTVFGERISFEPEQYHSYIFRSWLMAQDYENRDTTEPKPSEVVRKLFTTARFMPLPVALEESDEMESGKEMCRRVDEDDVMNALVYDPSLLPVIAASGYTFSDEKISDLIYRWHEEFQDPKMIAKHVNIMRSLRPDGIVYITPTFAREVFQEADNVGAPEPCACQTGGAYNIWRAEAEHDEIVALAKRDLLVSLDRAKALPFRLGMVIKGYRAWAAASIKSNCKRSRDEDDDDDEVVEVDARGEPVSNKKARRS